MKFFRFYITLLIFSFLAVNYQPLKGEGLESKNVTVNARFYKELKNLLRTGDTIGITVARNNPNIPLNKKKFQNAINLLQKGKKGINKSIVFSSINDLEKFIKYIPSNIKIIGYNVEKGITPKKELQNLAESIKKFSNLVHKSGRKMVFAPILQTYFAFEKKGILKDIISYIDIGVIQGQKILKIYGPEKLAEIVHKISILFNQYTPFTKISLQLWIDANHNDEENAKKALQLCENYIDTIILFSSKNAKEVKNILRFIRL